MLEHGDSTARLSPDCRLAGDRQADRVTIRLYGQFDMTCDERFREEVEQLVTADVMELSLDLRALTFMDSTGLRSLITIAETARRRRFELSILCSGSGAVRDLLRETGLDGVLPVVGPDGPIPATDTPV